MNGSRLIVLAPSKPDAAPAQRIASVLTRADHWPAPADAGARLYDDLFAITPTGCPTAALTRQGDAGDAEDRHWLRADPAHFRAEMANVRLMGCGAQTLRLDLDEAQALVAALAPVFGDEGFELSAPDAGRWYLRAFASNAVPDFPVMATPDEAIGRDIFELWPEDHIGRRWRRLFSEAQIVLAQHPLNRRREQAKLPAINGLWFHGAGRLPRRVDSPLSAVSSADPLLCALAKQAGVALIDAAAAADWDGHILFDLRGDASPLPSLLDAWDGGRISELEWRSPAGRWLRKRWHRWRFWRR